jgi:hypothetical protein
MLYPDMFDERVIKEKERGEKRRFDVSSPQNKE